MPDAISKQCIEIQAKAIVLEVYDRSYTRDWNVTARVVMKIRGSSMVADHFSSDAPWGDAPQRHTETKTQPARRGRPVRQCGATPESGSSWPGRHAGFGTRDGFDPGLCDAIADHPIAGMPGQDRIVNQKTRSWQWQQNTGNLLWRGDEADLGIAIEPEFSNRPYNLDCLPAASCGDHRCVSWRCWRGPPLPDLATSACWFSALVTAAVAQRMGADLEAEHNAE